MSYFSGVSQSIQFLVSHSEYSSLLLYTEVMLSIVVFTFFQQF
jgi:hypothetical protein